MLELVGESFTDEHLIEIELPSLTKLTIDGGGNDPNDDNSHFFTGRGVDAIVTNHSGSLTSVSIKEITEVGDETLRVIAEACSSSLQSLEIDKINLTDLGLVHISKACTALRSIRVTCNWNGAGWPRFHKGSYITTPPISNTGIMSLTRLANHSLTSVKIVNYAGSRTYYNLADSHFEYSPALRAAFPASCVLEMI